MNLKNKKAAHAGTFLFGEICQIRNRITKNITEVGNICVKRFLGVRSDLIFTAIKKRIRKDRTKSLNTASIVFFYDRGLLTEWEYGFLQDTLRKRALSKKQQQNTRGSTIGCWMPFKRRGSKALTKPCRQLLERNRQLAGLVPPLGEILKDVLEARGLSLMPYRSPCVCRPRGSDRSCAASAASPETALRLSRRLRGNPAAPSNRL